MKRGRKPAKPQTPKSYYAEFIGSFPSVDNKAAIESYFVNTQTDEEVPTDQTILSLREQKRIMHKFIARLMRDVAICALRKWVYETPLQNENDPIQPLGEF
jgi:hypothetical protein